MAVKDETGNIYGRLTVIKRGPNDKQNNAQWYCQCKCGNPNLVLIRGYQLRNGHVKSCGCLHIESAQKQGKANKKYNTYDLFDDFGIGYTTKGEEFYFDAEDYNLIKDYCWYIDKSGYVINRINNKTTLFHRLVMHAPDDKQVDHIYHKKNDNRKSQLRLCTNSENSMNRPAQKNSTSGIKGVYWYPNQGKWAAEIVFKGKRQEQCFFDTQEEAIQARKEMEEKYFGEFSYKEGCDV